MVWTLVHLKHAIHLPLLQRVNNVLINNMALSDFFCLERIPVTVNKSPSLRAVVG